MAVRAVVARAAGGAMAPFRTGGGGGGGSGVAGKGLHLFTCSLVCST